MDRYAGHGQCLLFHGQLEFFYSRRTGQFALRYSGAYYHAPDMSLEAAQIAKMRLVAEKLDLKPGGRFSWINEWKGFETALVKGLWPPFWVRCNYCAFLPICVLDSTKRLKS